MSIYSEKILPHLINCACSTKDVMHMREKVVPQAYGRVLEVGMGSGINFPLYDMTKVEFVWGLEPSAGMRKKAQKNIDNASIEVRTIDSPGEEIPLDDESVDTVLLTYTLCTIPDWQTALRQMYRVLKPEGKLLFCEHGLAPDSQVRKWQDRLNPIWKHVAGGCNMNRPIRNQIEHGGFKVEEIETDYEKNSPRVLGYTFVGKACK
ncbi:MAG: class I SAM-dependent methyltransferase [Gammaproteobacteria bacterium]|nr:class I SAM-dependent methyltransferase [Gammaproteobacteria bacterium]